MYLCKKRKKIGFNPEIMLRYSTCWASTMWLNLGLTKGLKSSQHISFQQGADQICLIYQKEFVEFSNDYSVLDVQFSVRY